MRYKLIFAVTGQNYTFLFFERNLILKNINEKFENNGVFCQISLHFMYKVHLASGVVYNKILNAFDAL